MVRYRLVGSCVVLLVAVGIGVHAAQDKGKAGTGKQRPAPAEKGTTGKSRTSKERYAIVQVGADKKVVKVTDLARIRKEAEEKYREELKAYDEARQSAAKNKQKFTEPRPVKPLLRVLASNLATEEAARARLAAIEKAESAKKSGTTAKRKPGASPPPKKEPSGS